MASVTDFRYFVSDITGVPTDAIYSRLRTEGLLFFRFNPDRRSFIKWFSGVFCIRYHPDCAPDGVTEITASYRRPDHGATAGFSTEALPLHVDGSTEPTPPPVLCLLMVLVGRKGGHIRLSDGLALYNSCSSDPHLAKLLSSEYRAKIRGRDFPIFDPVANPALRILRFRQDTYLESSQDISEGLLRKLADELNRNAINVALRPGDGYLLHNHRWTHGRTAFRGKRLAWRLIGCIPTSSDYSDLNDGFLTNPLIGSDI